MSEQMASFNSHKLSYRLLTVDDVSSQYVGWLNDPDVNRYLELGEAPVELDDVRRFIKSAEGDPDVFLFGIFEKTNNFHIGNIKFHYESARHKRGNIGLLIGEKHFWGMGLATEAICSIADYCFEFTDVEKLYAGAFSSNQASIKAFQKAGFSLDGVSRLHVLNGGIREDSVHLCLFRQNW